MWEEIKSASTFLVSLLRLGRSLSEQQLEIFRKAMENILSNHYQLHWFPDKPCKGSGYRCIRINHQLDPLLANAAKLCGLVDSSLLRNLLPNELTLWVDPKEVSYRIGENGSICVLFDGSAPKEVERLKSCKDSMRGYNNLIMDSHNRSLAGFVSS